MARGFRLGAGWMAAVLCAVALGGCGSKPVLSLGGKDARLVGTWAGGQILTAREDGEDETAGFGRVVLQEPASGAQTGAGTRVSLYMNTGEEELVTVPNLLGIPYGDAEKAVEESCLMVGRTLYAPSAEVPAGSVLSQEPAAGAQIQALGVVQVTVSLGQPHSQQCIPDFSGITGWRAVRQHLMAYGLSVEVEFMVMGSTSLPGACEVSTPRGGTEDCPYRAEFGDAVRLAVSLGPQGTVSVPSVVGLRLWEARDLFVQSGIVVGQVLDASARPTITEPDPWTTREPLSATVTFTEDEFEITHSTGEADALWKSLRVSGPYAVDADAEPGRIDMGARKVKVTSAVMRGVYNLFMKFVQGGPGSTSHGVYEFTDEGKLLLVVTSVDMVAGTFATNSAQDRPGPVSEAASDSNLIVYELTRQE